MAHLLGLAWWYKGSYFTNSIALIGKTLLRQVYFFAADGKVGLVAEVAAIIQHCLLTPALNACIDLPKAAIWKILLRQARMSAVSGTDFGYQRYHKSSNFRSEKE